MSTGVIGQTIVVRGRKVVPGVAEGEALVTREPISGWGGVDPRNGTVIETRHELRGQSFAGKVLVFPGLGANDLSTLALRRFLKQHRYVAHGWDQGFNLGPRDGVLDEAFTYSDGSTQRRVWTIRKTAPGRYAGTAADVVLRDIAARVAGVAPEAALAHYRVTLKLYMAGLGAAFGGILVSGFI